MAFPERKFGSEGMGRLTVLASLSPIRFAGVIMLLLTVAGIVGVSIYVQHAMRAAALETALRSNLDLVSQIKMVRGYYTSNILPRVTAGGIIKPSMEYTTRPNEVPLPATLVKDLSALMQKNDTSLSLVSPYPWPHRSDRVMTDFEREAWAAFQADPDKVVSRQEVINGQRVLRAAVADRMTTQACVNCHNSDPQSVRRDWKVGDVRAVFEVSRVIEPELLNAEKRSRYIIGALTAGGFAVAILLFVFIRRIERQSRAKRVADQQAYYLAEHDVLTGLHNRASLCEAVDAAYATPGDAVYSALVLLDLDHFKAINDTYGHGIGDAVLREVSVRMQDACKPNDLIARLGGDEFAVLVAGDPTERQVLSLAMHLCSVLAEPFDVDGHDLSIGASAGIAFLQQHATNTTDILIAADLALYAAKGAGRGTAQVFTQDLTIAALKRRRLEADLREALDAEQFEIHYQPIASLRTGKITKLEALTRWRHPERGLIPPADFIPVAEETGLIVPLGAWVIRRACLEVAQLADPLRVAINLSPIQLQHETLVPSLREALAISGIDPSRVNIEITEGVMVENNARTLALLNEIRGLGIKISMDDFGTGYSCLSYLQDYPIDCIKIDKSFVATLGQTESARPIVGAIIALARAIGMTTVAEGVETSAQLAELTELGCDEVQGFLLCRPRRIDDFRMARTVAIPAEA